ncbi:Iron/ascorbate family oxidoreductase [Handroanthus impetiginosus]|uniref:Iron/ascorbate family oxidoreductase n=1 Tax=Handroanthus impetiginosus TaxID=429701 RepID=A0A2G9HQX2_9LAMI|nr:Iron/ascorbate family oxidoreductase [Handroanthus impetiginosus]
MDSSSSTLILPPPLNLKPNKLLGEEKLVLLEFLGDYLEFGFFNGDQEATLLAASQIKTACLKHGFFQVINHGVDESVIQSVHQQMDAFFKLPFSKKLSVRRKPGGLCGYSGAHADRFSDKLPWKETFSFTYEHANSCGLDVVNYIKSVLGQEFEEVGYVYQTYCEAMKTLSLVILELLAISLGVDRLHYRKLLEDGSSIMRGNNYPPCREAGLTLGTGPHSDPSSLTYEALSNGRYKSCLHRAVVNKDSVRRSLVFFVNPKEDKIVRPPQDLMSRQEERQYPDFTWSHLREFTQNHYRADTATLRNFVQWLSLLQQK